MIKKKSRKQIVEVVKRDLCTRILLLLLHYVYTIHRYKHNAYSLQALSIYIYIYIGIHGTHHGTYYNIAKGL